MTKKNNEGQKLIVCSYISGKRSIKKSMSFEIQFNKKLIAMSFSRYRHKIFKQFHYWVFIRICSGGFFCNPLEHHCRRKTGARLGSFFHRGF